MSSHDPSPAPAGFRLSPQQEVLGDRAPVALTQCAVALAPGVATERLQRALDTVVADHEILRTSLQRIPGMRARQQLIAPHASVVLSEEPEAGALAEPEVLGAALAAAASPPLELEHGPLLRARVLRGADGDALVLTAAAVCLDAASMPFLLAALAAAVHDDAGDGGAGEPLQYADYAEWRHEFLTEPDPSGESAQGRAFWREHADERPAAAALPAGLAAPEHDAGGATGRMPALALEGEDHARLRAAAAHAGVPESTVLEAIWHAVIARVTGAAELEAAAWVDGRGQADLHGAVGPYEQPVPIRTRVAVQTSCAELIDQVSRARVSAERYADHAGVAELSALAAGAAAGLRVHAPASRPAPFGPILALRGPTAPGLVTLELLLGEHTVRGELSFDTRTHQSADVAALAGWLHHAVDSALADPGQAAHGLALTSPAQRAALLATAAGPAPADGAATLFPEAFAAAAARTPDAAAVIDALGELSYRELDARSARLAHTLRGHGAGPDVPVGLCVERGREMIVALVGILRAGSAYVPLHPEHPVTRRLGQLADAGAAALVGDDAALQALTDFEGPLVAVGAAAAGAQAAEAGSAPAAPEIELDPGDLAYVMYTSGSTGTPKGVGVTHANLANYTAALVARLQAGEEPLRYGVISAISTDLGNTTIFTALASGGTLVVASAEAAMDPGALAAQLDGRPLDVLKLAPSHLGALLAADTLPRRWLLLGGEALSWELVERVRALGAGPRILNHYGPTEAAIGTTTYDVDERPRADSATVPIGFPLPGTRVYVLDALGAPVPDGVAGELCVAGAGVAAGYVGDPAAGDERFVADPHGEGRMYRTGDRVRRLRDGAIEFLGRIDDQVKVRGYRVEPGEIEAALSSHPDVRQSAVVAEPQAGGGARLVAYLVAAAAVTVEDLQAHLARTLPDYMIPSAFLLLDVLPLTASGKVDRHALGDQAAAAAGREATYTAPRDAIEEGIAAIWAELLGVPRVGIDDDFFALGGHSLLATQAIMRIRREHGDVPLRALLAAPTVAELAAVVRAASESGAPGQGG